MLYISRVLGTNKWGVMDTDDYVETPCTYQEIFNAVMLNHLDIKGVSHATTHLTTIEVYQDPALIKKFQPRLALMYGVDIRVIGDDITAIAVPGPLHTKDAKLVLSTFGRTCSKCILQFSSLGAGERLVFILDDKIKIKSDTFRGIGNIGNVFLDVTNCTSKQTVERAYFSDSNQANPFLCQSYIIDHPERLDFYTGVSVLVNGLGPHSANFQLEKSFRDFASVCQKLEAAYKTAFLELVDNPIRLKSGPSVESWARLFLTMGDSLSLQEKVESGVVTFADALADGYSCFWVWHRATCKSKKLTTMFEHFIKYFHPSKEMQDAYVRMCIKTIKFFLDRSNWEGR